MDTIASGHAAALWAGLHLFLLLILSLLVVRLRQKHKVALGDEGIPELARAIRAFGNATEYVPTGVAALAVLAVAGASPLAIHVVGFILFAGRAIHAFGRHFRQRRANRRMVATWLAYIFAGVALLLSAIG